MNNFSNYDPNQMMLENFNTSNMSNNGMMGMSGQLGNNSMMSNPNIATVSNQMSQMNQMNQMSNFPSISNDNIMSMANNIDSLSMSNPNMQQRMDLNGTNLMDLSVSRQEDNSSLIKSLTKEIISNLKDSNIDLYDKKDRFDSESESESSSRKRKKKKDKSMKEDLQDYMEEQNPVPSTNKYLSMIFSDSFNVKDFFLLFGLYFLFSQNMIKDFFAKYFSCLNPDEDGKVHIQGVIVYGLLLTVMFMLLKKVI